MGRRAAGCPARNALNKSRHSSSWTTTLYSAIFDLQGALYATTAETRRALPRRHPGLIDEWPPMPPGCYYFGLADDTPNALSSTVIQQLFGTPENASRPRGGRLPMHN